VRHVRAAMRALAAERPALAAELHRVPFFLEPWYCDQPRGWWETHTTRQVRKFGSLEAFERVKAAHRLMPRARDAGLDACGWTDQTLDGRRQSSTLRAHRLVAWLDATVGWERAEEAYATLSKAHFVEQQLLDDDSVLLAAAEAAGVRAAAAAAFLEGDEADAAVRAAAEAVQRMGVHSIPTLLVNGQLALSGAAPADEVLDALRAAADAKLPPRRCFIVV
jgi:predicted DsbA family dithiol-disulfide isomerase